MVPAHHIYHHHQHQPQLLQLTANQATQLQTPQTNNTPPFHQTNNFNFYNIQTPQAHVFAPFYTTNQSPQSETDSSNFVHNVDKLSPEIDRNGRGTSTTDQFMSFLSNAFQHQQNGKAAFSGQQNPQEVGQLFGQADVAKWNSNSYQFRYLTETQMQ